MRATSVAHRELLDEDLQSFSVYRSGAGVSLLCKRCSKTKKLGREVLLAALLDEAMEHNETCTGDRLPLPVGEPL
jgi:hypothetical protein